LNKKQFTENQGVEEKVAYYEEANKQVAILCNHQKTVSKNFNAQSETLQNFVRKYFLFKNFLIAKIKKFIFLCDVLLFY
jgi:hypothetical protein